MDSTGARRHDVAPTETAKKRLIAPTIAHTLDDDVQLVAISKRLKRAHGQLGAVVRMLDEGSSCEEIVTQMAAVSKAVNTAAFNLISASLKECLVDPGVDSGPMTEKFQKLFLSLA
jgi:DNA-binding FrmR family transcriptional regulator